jgi:hypothetical protein
VGEKPQSRRAAPAAIPIVSFISFSVGVLQKKGRPPPRWVLMGDGLLLLRSDGGRPGELARQDKGKVEITHQRASSISHLLGEPSLP